MKNEPNLPNLLCPEHDAGWRGEESCALCQIEKLIPLGDLAFWKLIYVGKWGEILLRPGALEFLKGEFGSSGQELVRGRLQGASLYE